MKTGVICLSFLLCLGSLALTSEEEELRQINLGQLGPSLTSLLTAGAAGAGTAALISLLSGGGKGKHGLYGNMEKTVYLENMAFLGKTVFLGNMGKERNVAL